ncbi:MAG: thioredoxin family protein [Gaiellales bacterium]|nr:thioredoxin family protein [Gaiellales bacterium]
MKVQILGTGCPKCHKLEANTLKAVKQMGLDIEVVKVTDLNAIMNFGVMMTPALAVDGQVKTVGKVPDVAEITSILATEAAARDTCGDGRPIP